jgi:hypothetical protein
MSKIKIDNYSFDKTTGKITFTDYATIRLDAILLITNVTSNVIIYNFADATKGGTVATNVLTLTFSTSSMNNTDKLLIYYDDSLVGPAVSVISSTLPTGAATSAKQLADGHNVAVNNIPAYEPITQYVTADAGNSSSTNIVSGGYFSGATSTTLGVAGIQVSLRTDQNCTVWIDQAPTNALVDNPTGTTAATNDSTVLTGTGTYFTKNMAIGDTIVFDPTGTNQTRTVASVTSDTVLNVTYVTLSTVSEVTEATVRV